jgi:gluconolactonase
MEIDVVCSGLKFPEGPIAMRDGSVLLVEMQRETLTRVDADGDVEVIAKLGGSPNGAALGPGGGVFICNSGGYAWREVNGRSFTDGHKPPHYTSGSIQHVRLDTGEVSTLYTCDGDRQLSGPNDIVFDRHGGMWFTDFGRSDERHKDHGCIYYAKADGSSLKRVIMLEGVLGAPNGIGLSQDELTLFIADTYAARIWSFDLAEPGKLAAQENEHLPGRVIGSLPGLQLIDSLAIDNQGNVCAATLYNGGISIIREGVEPKHVAIPDNLVTNICFGGEDMRTAWITGAENGRLFRCQWPTPGQRLNFQD